MEDKKSTMGSQTLLRGLDVLEAVGNGSSALTELAASIGLTKSTTHRLASALIERGFLSTGPRSGYKLGPKLLELGHLAQSQVDLVAVARPFLEALAATTEDTVHLGILDGHQALYLDKIAGQRRINISSRVGDRQPLSSTGLGKALMLDEGVTYWRERYRAEQPGAGNEADWLKRMRNYAAAGYALDLEENEDQIRCVAGAIRDARGVVVGAISVSSAAQYMSNERIEALTSIVRCSATEISRSLGAQN